MPPSLEEMAFFGSHTFATILINTVSQPSWSPARWQDLAMNLSMVNKGFNQALNGTLSPFEGLARAISAKSAPRGLILQQMAETDPLQGVENTVINIIQLEALRLRSPNIDPSKYFGNEYAIKRVRGELRRKEHTDTVTMCQLENDRLGFVSLGHPDDACVGALLLVELDISANYPLGGGPPRLRILSPKGFRHPCVGEDGWLHWPSQDSWSPALSLTKLGMAFSPYVLHPTLEHNDTEAIEAVAAHRSALGDLSSVGTFSRKEIRAAIVQSISEPLLYGSFSALRAAHLATVGAHRIKHRLWEQEGVLAGWLPPVR